MSSEIVQQFVGNWPRYFPGEDLPLALFYSDEDRYFDLLRPREGFGCMIAQISLAAAGERVAFAEETLGCAGGVKYSGFRRGSDPDLGHFLSCGIPGKVEGLRLKKSPDLVHRAEESMRPPPASGKYLLAVRLDRLESGETPQVVAWLAPPDVISALMTLAAFHQWDRNCVISPQTSGCGSIISYPMSQTGEAEPKAVIGMFDISARPYVRKDCLSFAVPFALFATMTGNMDESFLTTSSWQRVMKRL